MLVKINEDCFKSSLIEIEISGALIKELSIGLIIARVGFSLSKTILLIITSGASLPAASFPSNRILYIEPFTNRMNDFGRAPPCAPLFFFPPARVIICVVFGSVDPPTFSKNIFPSNRSSVSV